MTSPERSPYISGLEVQMTAQFLWTRARKDATKLRGLNRESFLEIVRTYIPLQFNFTFGEDYKRLPLAHQDMQTDYGKVELEHHLESSGSADEISIDTLKMIWGNNDWNLEVVLSSSGETERLLNAKVIHEDQTIEVTSITNP